MEQLIDIHCHILPAVDNGSVSMDQTKKMLKIAHEQGITFIIATPHYGAECINADGRDLDEKLQRVKLAARELAPDFQIELGNEIFYSEAIVDHLRKGKARTLAGTCYCLVKFPKEEEFQSMKEGLHRLLMQGFYPILSHMESYSCLYRNYEVIAELINLGAYMQMNTQSLLGSPFDSHVKYARKLMAYDMVHFLGTGSHSDHLRAPLMKEGVSFIDKTYGWDARNRLMDNTRKLLLNQKVQGRLYTYL